MRCRRCATGCSIEEMGARPDAGDRRDHRDRDAFDAVADHLLVVDHAIGAGAEGSSAPTG